VVVVNAGQVEQAADCREIREEIRDYKRVYEEVLRELDESAPKADWNTKYMEFTKR
jgi:hypothetical protein